VDIEWRSSKSSISQSNRISVADVMETRPLHYQSSLLLHSLDKSKDEDNYTCVIRTNIRRKYKNTSINDAVTRSVQLSSMVMDMQVIGLIFKLVKKLFKQKTPWLSMILYRILKNSILPIFNIKLIIL